MIKLVLIDCGHCLRGADTGTGGYGLREEKCTREIGAKLKAKLEAIGYIVVLINCDEASSVTSSINFRVNQANKAEYSHAIMVISIHLNAGGGRGAEIYTKNGANFTEAVNILKALEKEGYVHPNGKSRGIKSGNNLGMVASVNNSKAMLVEGCFMDSEDMNNYDANKIANAIFTGITGSTSSTDTPPAPSVPKPTPPTGEKKYLFLNAHVSKWNVYPTNVAPVTANACGALAPSQFGGLEYEILGNPQTDVYTIQTESFGRVNIYVPKDGDSKFYNKGGSVTPPMPPVQSNNKYLNLHKHNSTWRVYPLNKSATIGNEVGSLAPSQYGGLSYHILENKGDIKIINTSSFGKVQIFAPLDNDSSITSNPLY